MNISSDLSLEIKDGTFSNYLLKPYSIWTMSLMRALARKINSLALILPLYGLTIISFSAWKEINLFSPTNIILAIIALLGGLILHLMIDLTITWSAFWLEDVWFFWHIKYVIFGLLGGVYFPLNILPTNLKNIFEFLPFKFFYYQPISYFLERPTAGQLQINLIQLLSWIILFLLLSIWLWKKGISKYEAYGK
jgi:ABC-2 type transport system permease protein